MKQAELEQALLAGIAPELIHAAYGNAPGNEIASGKFFSPESSSALAANVFGLFLGDAAALPPLVNCDDIIWPARSVQLEATVRFPWRGGLHPCLDVLIETGNALIGVESKRYEPFRPRKQVAFSDAYWRPVWGENMRRYEAMRDQIHAGGLRFTMLDAVQLIKHAFGLRTRASRSHPEARQPWLFYVYAEPEGWPDGRPIDSGMHRTHRAEIEAFADLIQGDEVRFRHASYRELLAGWATHETARVRDHAAAISSRFRI